MAELPSTVFSLISLLQKCRRNKNLASAKGLHAHIRKNGMESHIAIGNHMVPMFVECGGLYEAQQVFDRLAYRNEHSWTSLMSGYIDCGEAHHALNLYRKMQEDFVQPSSYTYMAAMKACAGLKNLERGQEIHMDVARKGSERDLFVGNSLVDMYAKCGLLEEALEVLEKMPVQNVVTWTTLMAGYVEHGRGQEAVRCFEDMQEEHVSPNAVTFVCILKACASTGVIDKGLEIHADIVHKGFEEDLFVGNTLVDMYTKCGSLPSAQEVFDKLPIRDSVSWNALIAGYAEHEPGEYTLKTFEQMQMGGVPPDTVTFICALKACGNLRAIVKGQEIHADISGKGFERDIFVGNALVDMYAKSGLLVEAQDALDKLPFRDVVSWNALIAGYAEKAFGEKALKCFEQMQAEGITPDSVTFVSTIKACGATIGTIGRGQGIHKGITQLGYERDVIVGSALVDMYAGSGSLIEAREVFDKLPVRHVMLWTALIAGYAEHGLCEEALTCYETMQIEGVPPDTVTFVCLLKACGSIGALYKGHQMHIDLAQKGFETDLLVGSSLVDMYAKLGSLLEACKVFENLPMQDAVLWSAMIRGYGMNHEGGMAIKCFESMQEQGVKPDDVTFMCVLSACSHARLVFKGQEFFNVMREEYGFIPTVNHYTCMVDLLAKSGHLHEAEKFLEAMSCPPLWTALLTACKVHGEADLGLRCFQQLVQLDPECSAPYVLMSNVYAATGQWNDAYRIEEMRKHEGLSKKPATALIEVNKKVHQFVVGENQSKEISAILESMSSRMKVKGHVPNVSLVL